MEKVNKMLGIVTLYNPDRNEVLQNIGLYLSHIDFLIVWDNSSDSHFDWFDTDKICYKWDGTNHCIAPALNYAWQYARSHEFSNVLIMDEDSKWEDFSSYRRTIESLQQDDTTKVFTPYVVGCDTFGITSKFQEKRLFINSGTVIPVEILSSINGVDEDAFPLDALDHDLSLSIIEHGYKTICLTECKLYHSLGYPKRLGPFHLFTPDYNSFRTYQMTRSHIICYRKHHSQMNEDDKDYLFKEILLRKFFRIIFAESDKFNRMKSFLKGIIQGVRYKIKQNNDNM